MKFLAVFLIAECFQTVKGPYLIQTQALDHVRAKQVTAGLLLCLQCQLATDPAIQRLTLKRPPPIREIPRQEEIRDRVAAPKRPLLHREFRQELGNHHLPRFQSCRDPDLRLIGR